MKVVVAQTQNSNLQKCAVTLKMLIVLYICLLLMPYDSSDMSLCDIETTVLFNQSRKMYCDLSLSKFGFQLNYSSYSSYIGFFSPFLRIL